MRTYLSRPGRWPSRWRWVSAPAGRRNRCDRRRRARRPERRGLRSCGALQRRDDAGEPSYVVPPSNWTVSWWSRGQADDGRLRTADDLAGDRDRQRVPADRTSPLVRTSSRQRRPRRAAGTRWRCRSESLIRLSDNGVNPGDVRTASRRLLRGRSEEMGTGRRSLRAGWDRRRPRALSSGTRSPTP